MRITIKRWVKSVIFLCLSIFFIGAAILFTGLSGLTITGNETYTDPDELTIANSTVESGGSLTLKAGNKIRLLPGFHAKQGSNLQAEIDKFTWNLPTNRRNTRFTIDHFDIPRPALSMRSFDNTKNDNYSHQYSSTTYGVRQVLEKAYGIGQPQVETAKKTFEQIISQSKETLRSFTSGNAEYNSSVLESMAFVTLMSYVIQQNQEIFEGKEIEFPGMPTHATARTEFIDALRGRGNYFRDVNKENAFKRSRPLMKVARTWDLYLALENAYEDLGGDLSLLLNYTDKNWWNNAIYKDLKKLWQQTNDDVPWAGWATGVQLHEAQAGNWPLISFVGAGYVALGFNGSFTPINDADDPNYFHDLESILATGMKSTAFHYSDSNNKRYNYWWYQTSEGEPFWAEGAYYLEVALPRVLEFWHVIRANNMLNFSSEGDGIDPFRYSNFLEPLKWYANIATPDGNTPPYDDGNKTPMRSSALLSWSTDYGNEVTGKKFAFIRDLPEIGGPGSTRDHRLVEIAIPRQPIGTGTAPPDNYGNSSSSSELHKQTVIRRNDSEGYLHYIFMNGESGDAILRGEGHEQADQLQLLYYVDKGAEKEISYLMDTGYDNATGTTNSTWNIYYKHNLLSIENAPDGGLPSPSLTPSKKRKTSIHNEVDELFYSTKNGITILKGDINIDHYNINGQKMFTTSNKRTILFLEEDKDNEIPSRLIDLYSNEGKPRSIAFQEHVRHTVSLRYYSNTLSTYEYPDGWRSFRYGGDKNDLFYYADLVESPIEDNDKFKGTDSVAEENTDPYGVSFMGMGTENTRLFSSSWSAISLIQHSSSKPNYTPKQLINYSSENFDRKYQAWSSKVNNFVVDVIIKRGKPFGDSGYNTDVTFSVPDANNLQLELEGGKDFGFARLVFENGTWEMDSDYQVNLEQVYPITLTLSGPITLSVGEQGTWTANASVPPGAPGNFSYKWYYRSDDPQANGNWLGPVSYSNSWSTQMYDFDNFLDIKVNVNRGGESVSTTRYVFCEDCGGGGGPLLFSSISPKQIIAADTTRQVKQHPDSVKAKTAIASINELPQLQNELPEEFDVLAPYPNPFNPETVLSFTLPQQSYVRIRVYNMLGRPVATLTDQTLEAGRYEARFNASRLSSGIYFIRTEMNNEIFNRKVTLIK